MNNTPIAYRPDIDGLRAIAVVSVVLFHAFPAILPGGFVGVDIFFVISGYLISGIILTGLAEGKFSFRDFYTRRIRRIFPALIVVLAFCLAAGWFVLLPDEYQLLGKHVAGGAFYISNFILRREAGYFDTAAEYKPLLHLWSLSIEEQFYIFFPLAMVLAYRYRLNLLTLVVAVLWASFIYNVLRVDRNPVATFFLPATRIWELLIGVLLACGIPYGQTALGRWLAAPRHIPAGLRAAAGMAGIILPMFLLDKATPFPGWAALAPTLGAVLLISAGTGTWINRILLAHPAIVFIGLISYPLYLWHWPLLSLARIANGGTITATVTMALVALSILLAVLTYRLLERPIRFGSVSRFRVAGALMAVCLALGATGFATNHKAIPPYANRFGVDRIIAAAGEWDYPGSLKPFPFEKRKVWQKAGTGRPVVLIGDSNLEQYAPRVAALLDQAPQTFKPVIFISGGGCPPIPAITAATHPHCSGLLDDAIALADQQNADTVVLAAQWWGYFQSTGYKVNGAPLTDPVAAETALASLTTTIQRLKAGDRRVFLVLNIPYGNALDPKNLVERSFPAFHIKKGGVPLADFEKDYGEISARITAAAAAAGATVIDPLRYLCFEGLCPATTQDGDPIYKDSGHLRPAYVRQHVEYLDIALRNAP